MASPLDDAIAIVMEFEAALEHGRQLWVPKNADATFEHEWQKKYARCWIHGVTHISDSNEVERSKVDMPTLSPMATSNAKKCIERWRRQMEDRDDYYEPFENFAFTMPTKDENLAQFVYKMAVNIEREGLGKPLERRAFNSFLAFLREHGPEAAFLELVFPQKMHLHHGRIARKISNEAYAIPEETAASILVALAKNCQNGRKDAQLTAAECLGLCWLCLTASRLRLPVYFEDILSLDIHSLRLEEPLPTLNIPILFGGVNIKISKRMGKFLHTLSCIPATQPRKTILQRTGRSLTRTFDEILKVVIPNFEYGNITFVSLLSPPHHFGQRRYQTN